MLRELKYKFLNRKGILNKPEIDCFKDNANTAIADALTSASPTMITRFGAFELGMASSVYTPLNIRNLIKLIDGSIASIGYNKKLAESFCNNAGFFPNDRKQIEKYAHQLVNDMKELDVLGSWLPAERQFEKQLGHCIKIPLKDLEPFHHTRPWTLQLQNKKVLVIHPFHDTIKYQWKKRKHIFKDMEIMPECDLQIMKSVQSIAGNETGFTTWFDALAYMEDEIGKRDFDIALLGCGAYGFNLAAHIKRMGRKAVHLGGFLQILFGIMGKRWEDKYPFVNEYWIRPLDSDKPKGANSIENGCYW